MAPALGNVPRRGKRVDKLQSDDYWSGTAYAPDPAINAWKFNTNDGNQNNTNQNNQIYAVAVRPGG